MFDDIMYIFAYYGKKSDNTTDLQRYSFTSNRSIIVVHWSHVGVYKCYFYTNKISGIASSLYEGLCSCLS